MNEKWVADYFKMLLPADPEVLDIQAAQLLKLANLPQSLFRYRVLPSPDSAPPTGQEATHEKRKRVLREIESGEVLLSPPDAFNDLYDSSFCILNKPLDGEAWRENLPTILEDHRITELLTEDEIEQVIVAQDSIRMLGQLVLSKDPSIPQERIEPFLEHVESRLTDWQTRVYGDLGQHMREGMRVCCFSSVVDSVLMWSHYADTHRGVCIEYDVAALPADDPRRYALCPVLYSRRLFDASEYFRRAREGDFNNMWLTLACLHKSEDWSYEKEWRLVVPLGPGQALGQTVPLPIKALYLGSRAPSSTESDIVAAAVKQNLPVFKMGTMQNSFELVAEPIR